MRTASTSRLPSSLRKDDHVERADRIGPGGGDHARWNGDEQRQQHGEDDKLQADGETRDDILEDRPGGEDGLAPIPLEQACQPPHVLHEQRLIETIGVPQLVCLALIVHIPQEQVDGVAGDEAHHGKDQQGDGQHRRDQQAEFFGNVLFHGCSFCYLSSHTCSRENLISPW